MVGTLVVSVVVVSQFLILPNRKKTAKQSYVGETLST